MVWRWMLYVRVCFKRAAYEERIENFAYGANLVELPLDR